MARSKRGRRKKPFKLKLKRESLYTIASVFLLSVGGLIILSFSQQGKLLRYICFLCSRLFGFGALFLPFLFISAGLMLTKLRWKICRPHVFIGSLLLFLSFIGLLQTGQLGKEIFQNIAVLITGLGAFLILLGCGFVGFVVLFETSFEDVFLFLARVFSQTKMVALGVLKPFKKKPFPAPVKIQVQEKEKEKEKEKGKVPVEPEIVVSVPGAQKMIWEYPPLSLLSDEIGGEADRGDIKKNTAVVEQTLGSFGIQAKVAEVNFGPAVTQYALEIAPGTKLSRITALSNDLALALAAPTGQIRIEAPIPGRSMVGVEVPNRSLEFVTLKRMLTSEKMKKAKHKLIVSLGLDVSGRPMVANLARMPHVLIAGATGSGKTCAKDTLVVTGKGILTFEELCPLPLNWEKEFKLKIATRDGIEETSKVYNNGICDFYKITTDDGFTVEVTPEHPLWAMKKNGKMGWKAGEKVRAGDYLAIARGDGLFGNKIDLSDFVLQKDPRNTVPEIKIPKKMTVELAQFLGALVADGGLTIHNRVVYTQADETLLNLYLHLLDKLFGVENPSQARSGGNKKNKAKDVIIRNRYFKDFLAYLGLDDKKSREKEVPRSVRQAPREIVIAFLQSLMEHDAYIGKNTLSLTVASQSLARQVQLLLLNLGIISSLRVKKVKAYEKNEYFRLNVYGENFRKYIKEIGFIRPEKYSQVKKHLSLNHNPNKDVIPHLTRYLQILKETYRRRFARFTNEGWQYTQNIAVPKYAFSILKSYNVGNRFPSYQMLDRILGFYEPVSDTPIYQELTEVKKRNFYWSKVAKIEKTRGEGYDFEVPGSNSFIGNGFINHNTVCLNSFIATILFRVTPEEVNFILIDPKRVELTQYNGVPHLLTPVITDSQKVISALKWSIAEMERRYRLFAKTGTRNIDAYNNLSGFQALPYIIIIIDELADIILFAPAEVEDTITRIAQMARATGIHLVISTQRPSVDVLTGLIKANIPCRIAFNVTSVVDSRVILDMAGAEKLLGRGDMLYIPPEQARPTRVQGAYVSEPEIQKIINFLKKSGVAPKYAEEIITKYKPIVGGKITEEEKDELFEDAVRIICRYDRASASLLQRRLSIGYARAARILDQLQAAGIVGLPEGSKPREVLIRNAEAFLARRKS